MCLKLELKLKDLPMRKRDSRHYGEGDWSSASESQVHRHEIRGRGRQKRLQGIHHMEDHSWDQLDYCTLYHPDMSFRHYDKYSRSVAEFAKRTYIQVKSRVFGSFDQI